MVTIDCSKKRTQNTWGELVTSYMNVLHTKNLSAAHRSRACAFASERERPTDLAGSFPDLRSPPPVRPHCCRNVRYRARHFPPGLPYYVTISPSPVPPLFVETVELAEAAAFGRSRLLPALLFQPPVSLFSNLSFLYLSTRN